VAIDSARAIWKVTFGKKLRKQAMRKKILYTKTPTYILQLLFNIVITRTEALVILGNKFCMPE
jgi:hypothetical protein